MRKELDKISLVVLFAGIVALFWNNESAYGSATRRTRNEAIVGANEPPDFKGKPEAGNRPFITYIFNPFCPCSRYNISILKPWTVKDKNYTARQTRRPMLYQH